MKPIVCRFTVLLEHESISYQMWANMLPVYLIARCESTRLRVGSQETSKLSSEQFVKLRANLISLLTIMSVFFWNSCSKTLPNFMFMTDIIVVIVTWMKLSVKCTCGQEEVVQLGDVSGGFGFHADR